LLSYENKIKLLIKAGANIYIKSYFGYTAWYEALITHKKICFEILKWRKKYHESKRSIIYKYFLLNE